MEVDKLITTNEAVRLFGGIHPNSISRLCREAKLTVVGERPVLNARQKIYWREDMEALAAKYRAKHGIEAIDEDVEVEIRPRPDRDAGIPWTEREFLTRSREFYAILNAAAKR